MSVASAKATVAAKASTINTNIANIKTAAALYQMAKGNSFKESEVDAAALKAEDLIDIEEFNKVTTGYIVKNKVTTPTQVDSTILYAIQKGVDKGAGAYVICKFDDESEPAKIASALMGYKNLRIDTTNNTVGAFLYHNTPATKPATNAPAYETDFTYPTAAANP